MMYVSYLSSMGYVPSNTYDREMVEDMFDHVDDGESEFDVESQSVNRSHVMVTSMNSGGMGGMSDMQAAEQSYLMEVEEEEFYLNELREEDEADIHEVDSDVDMDEVDAMLAAAGFNSLVDDVTKRKVPMPPPTMIKKKIKAKEEVVSSTSATGKHAVTNVNSDKRSAARAAREKRKLEKERQEVWVQPSWELAS